MVMDILVRPVDRIAWNTTTWVEAVEQHMGGNGANTSYAAAVCGVAVRLVSVAGRDAFGDRLLTELAGAGVDVAHVRRTDGPTAATVALVNSSGDRLFLHRIGEGAEAFDPPESDSAISDGMSRFHLANLFALPGLRRRGSEILRGAREAGLTTSVDTGWDSEERWIEDLAPCLPWTDLLFVNQDEAQRLGGAPEIRDAARRLRDAGARTVVVKLGAQGCAVSARKASYAVRGSRLRWWIPRAPAIASRALSWPRSNAGPTWRRRRASETRLRRCRSSGWARRRGCARGTKRSRGWKPRRCGPLLGNGSAGACVIREGGRNESRSGRNPYSAVGLRRSLVQDL